MRSGFSSKGLNIFGSKCLNVGFFKGFIFHSGKQVSDVENQWLHKWQKVIVQDGKIKTILLSVYNLRAAFFLYV